MGPRVVLVGPMGAGKTTVAGLLGEAWQVPVRDTDADIVAGTGREISDIFVESGEDAFRGSRPPRSLPRSPSTRASWPSAGAPCSAPARDLLEGLTVVFLRVGLSNAVKRSTSASGAPCSSATSAPASSPAR